MRKLLTIMLFLITLPTLTACCGNVPEETHSHARVVNCITISCEDETRSYASEESMQAILAYLRNLTAVYSSESPPVQSPQYRITLIYSDGFRQEFSQQDQFFREADRDWQYITEHDVLALSKLFALLKPENIPSAI